MGACISKKGVQDEEKISSSSISTAPQPTAAAAQKSPPAKPAKDPEADATAAPAVLVKNPIHVSETQKDNEQANESAEEPKRSGVAAKEDCSNGISAATVRTSSCTKEEVDAILIQCGRLSRSSSGKGMSENGSRSGASGSGSRKYSGSKRSYDFDNDPADNNKMGGDDEMPQIRLTHRRTPSRERDGGSSELKRSSSRDEGRRSGSRRASRSPGRRQEASVEKTRPGKMVSVPATVSAARETGRRGSAATKRSGEVGGRSNASPRARSPANTRPSADQNAHHHNSQPSLSRNSSKKTEQSPYRRNPMNEIDGNVARNEQPPLKIQDRSLTNAKGSNAKPAKNTDSEEGLDKISHLQLQKSNENEIPTQRLNENGVRIQKSDERNIPAVAVSNKPDRNTSAGMREQLMNCRQKEQLWEPEIMEEPPAETKAAADGLNRPTLTRSRSSRRSRDLDIGVDLNPESLNPPTYASLLLEDIQNYHQQNSAVAPASFSLPACVSKARSILEAVADLNSCTTSNLSSGFSEYKSEADLSEHHNCSNNSFAGRLGKRRPTTFVESEMTGVNENDLMEPSLHKYVTVRNSAAASEMEPQESAGSNSFLSHHWISSWEPNSVDSTERWASASNASEEVEQKTLMNEVGPDHHELGGPRRSKRGGSGNSSGLGVGTASAGGKRRDFSLSQQGGSVGSGKTGVRSSSLPIVAAAAQ